MLTAALPPLGLFVFLPASSIWAISRYRQRRPLTLRGGQGARMGALVALLSFPFFVAFFLAQVSYDPLYRQLFVSKIQEAVAQNPDPQAQQMLQWFATTNGLITATAIGLAFMLVVFLIIGLGSGTLAVALGKSRNRPGP